MKATFAVLCFIVGVAYAITAADARASTKGRCNMNPDGGPCRASFSSFYFDKSTGKCKSFIYGGCGGNANRFPTKRECKRACKKGKQAKAA